MKSVSLICLALIVGLTACSTLPEKPPKEYRLSAMQGMQKQRNWRLDGRLSVVSEKDSVTASISWMHEATNDLIELTGPLAQGRVLVTIDPDTVTVDQGDGPQIYTGSADEVFAEQINMEMPVSALRFWVLGVNDPARPYQELSSGFVQDGWSVQIKEMQSQGAIDLPRKISVEKNGTRIKLIVDQWVLS